MATIVVAKRPRSFGVAVESPRSTRSKRRASEITEGNEADSIVVRPDSRELSVAPDAGMTPRTPKRTRRTAASGSRTPLGLSPQKVINSVFKSSKSSAAPTPSKLQEEPPKTPQHRAVLSAKKPTTPRHRVCVVSKPMTPRSKMLTTPTHPSTPNTILTTAKSLFSRSTQARGGIIGRDTERSQLDAFLSGHIASRKGGCLYISGPPGCGKSALLTETMGTLSGDETVTLKKAWINCMSLHTPGSIFASLLESFSPTASGPDLATLESLFIGPNTSTLYVLVLDEIDHLLTQDILPTLFELSLRPHSRLLLVGIANALDLTSRFLPRLKSRNLVPELLPFHPYNAPQINTVLTQRLRSLLPASHEDPTFVPFIHPAAVQLLSKKVAAASGDLRKAFDILRRAIELVELESLNALRQQQSALSETSVPNSPSRMTVKPDWSVLTSPRATLLHVTKAASTSLGASVASRIARLNAHQKAVLCVLAAKVGMGPMEVKKLRTEYSKACKEGDVGISPVGMGEFRDVVEGAEAVGMLEFVKEKGGAGEKVRSRLGKMELLTALGGQGVNGREGWVKILGS